MRTNLGLIALAATFFLGAGVHAAEPGNAKTPTVSKAPEAARQAVDRMLAETLNDPMSAIQYRVSQFVSCDDVSNRTKQGGFGPLCLCYEVNVRGASGGYGGRKTSIASLRQEKDDTYTSVRLWENFYTPNHLEACAAAGLEKRSSKLIHDLVD